MAEKVTLLLESMRIYFEKNKIIALIFLFLITISFTVIQFSEFFFLNKVSVACIKSLVAARNSDIELILSKEFSPSPTLCDDSVKELDQSNLFTSTQDSKLLEWKGKIQLYKGAYNKAINSFEEILANSPNNDTTRFLLGIAYSKSNNELKATENWSKLTNTSNAMTTIGDKFRANSSCEEALPFYHLAINFASNSLVHTYLFSGDCLNTLKRYSEAVDTYKVYLTLSQKDITIYNIVGNLLVGLNRPSEAILYYNQAVILTKNYNYMFNLAQAYSLSGQTENALYWANKAEEVVPISYSDLLKIGNFYSNNKLYQKAATLFERAIQIDTKCPAVCYTSLGTIYLSEDLPDKAVKTFEKALKLEPNNPEIKVMLNRALLALQKKSH